MLGVGRALEGPKAGRLTQVASPYNVLGASDACGRVWMAGVVGEGGAPRWRVTVILCGTWGRCRVCFWACGRLGVSPRKRGWRDGRDEVL